MLGFLFGRKKEENATVSKWEESGKISISGRLKSVQHLREQLGKLSIFSQIQEEEEGLTTLIVESTDKDKKPHLFIKLAFSQDSAKAVYSIPPEVPNPLARKLQVVKTLLTLLSLLEEADAFVPERADLYTKAMGALDLGAEFADADSLRMKYDLDRYVHENSAMKADLATIKQEKEGLDHQMLELERKCSHLEERVRQLEGMTDGELDREIVRWIGEHGGRLDEDGFCSAMRLSGSRLGERLDSLSKRGVIRIV